MCILLKQTETLNVIFDTCLVMCSSGVHFTKFRPQRAVSFSAWTLLVIAAVLVQTCVTFCCCSGCKCPRWRLHVWHLRQRPVGWFAGRQQRWGWRRRRWPRCRSFSMHDFVNCTAPALQPFPAYDKLAHICAFHPSICNSTLTELHVMRFTLMYKSKPLQVTLLFAGSSSDTFFTLCFAMCRF